MMDLSSVIDAGMVVMGAAVVLLMGLWTLSSESSTVSISKPQSMVSQGQSNDFPLPKAA